MLDEFRKHEQWPAAKWIIEHLNKNGFKAYLAGGCVRDALLRRPAKDLDIATEADPEKLCLLFPEHIAVGKDFGVIVVKAKSQALEVTTFRKDGEYKDGRHPESVIFSDEKEDALRRDFTVNGLFYDIAKDELLDYVNGQKDLELKILRTIGSAKKRFAEDKLRMLRAIRFAVELNFEVDKDLQANILSLHKDIALISKERITQEFSKTLQSQDPKRGYELLQQTQMLAVLFPEFEFLKIDLQREAFINTLPAQYSSVNLAYAHLLCFEMNYNKTKSSDAILKSMERQLTLSNYEKRSVKFCLDNIDRFMQADTRSLILMNHKDFGLLLWELAQLTYSNKEKQLGLLKTTFLRLCSKQTGHLPVNYLSGADLIEMGIAQGPVYQQILDEVYCLQLEGSLTDKVEAKNWVLTHFQND